MDEAPAAPTRLHGIRLRLQGTGELFSRGDPELQHFKLGSDGSGTTARPAIMQGDPIGMTREDSIIAAVRTLCEALGIEHYRFDVGDERGPIQGIQSGMPGYHPYLHEKWDGQCGPGGAAALIRMLGMVAPSISEEQLRKMIAFQATLVSKEKDDESDPQLCKGSQ